MTPGEDFLFLEGLIVPHLKTVLGEQIFVERAADLAGVMESGQNTPAVHVLYRGYRPSNAETDGFVGVIQTWLTVIAVRNVRAERSGEDARLEAGPIVSTVIKGLHGQRFKGARPFRLAPAPSAGFGAGFLYLPLAWEVGVYITNPCG